VRNSVFTGVNHICVVTTDLDRAVRAWSKRYGVGPWSIYAYDKTNMSATVDGRPADFAMRAALAQLGPNVRLEIIEPGAGESPYSQSLAEHGESDHIHHVRFDIADYGESRTQLEQLGLPVKLDATFKAGDDTGARLRGTYFDASEELGFIVEIADRPDGFTMPDATDVYP
jgi:glyoxalase/bleomycin resistance protein/dioxygenase superfamily protein